ncbi:succinate dehydrogenase assembly factor 2 [Mesorhizobium sp. NBSH29]|uniref:FAD assembly factor SdhE n=1 Tax=Mesorhizobium sp. NBSH29 TaxID=2654249 RepID=UPI0018965D07|nr:succinate dehydrogenase assembly factor 2 [Mesorhizobium sp. NBSH29]QPC87714.1 succinate dehydrogenase assembly factor 2 [Mesorhizobium sp. NBSH29]
MTGMTRSSAGLDARRRKLLFRSWHRGMREMDLIFGRFADARIEELTDAELADYEALLDISDTDMLPWITGEKPAPETLAMGVLAQIITFRRTLHP